MSITALRRFALFLFTACLTVAAPVAPVTPRNEDLNAPPIVGGNQVGSAAAYPFIANLQQSGSFICGATILSTTKVVTAAHCVVDSAATSFRIRVGSLNHASGGNLVSVSEKAVHPQYNANTVDYDVAVLSLAKALTFSSSVKAATIVASGSEPVAGRNVTIIGWGTTSEGGSASSTLRQITVPVVSHETCNNAYGGGSSITDRMFCAASRNKDSCNGDSGGPIFDASSKLLLGGVSWGQGCAEDGFPGVYADYANPELYQWIKAQL